MSLTGTVAQKKANNNSQQPLFNVRSSSSAKWWFSSVWRVLSPENCQSLSSLESTSFLLLPAISVPITVLPHHSSYLHITCKRLRHSSQSWCSSRAPQIFSSPTPGSQHTALMDSVHFSRSLILSTHARQFQLLFWSFASVNRNLTQQHCKSELNVFHPVVHISLQKQCLDRFSSANNRQEIAAIYSTQQTYWLLSKSTWRIHILRDTADTQLYFLLRLWTIPTMSYKL